MFEYKILYIMKKKSNCGLRKDNEKERLTDRVGVPLLVKAKKRNITVYQGKIYAYVVPIFS